MTLEQGSATFHFQPGHHSSSSRNQRWTVDTVQLAYAHADVYQVKIADAIVTAVGKCRFRADAERGHIRVEVISGEVLVATSTLSSQLGRGKVMESLSGDTEAAFDIHEGIRKDAWDQWAEAQELHLLSGAGRATDPNGSGAKSSVDLPTLR